MWLNLEAPGWLWPHVALTAVIFFGAAFGAYGFWQKLFVLDALLLINVQYEFLIRIPPEIGVQYTLLPGTAPPRRAIEYSLEREFYDCRQDST